MNENTNNTATEAGTDEQNARAEGRAEVLDQLDYFQKETFRLDPTVADQLDTMTRNLFEFCEAHKVPMLCSIGYMHESGQPNVANIRAFAGTAHAPRVLGLAAFILARFRDLGDKDAQLDLIGRAFDHDEAEAAKQDPFERLMRRLGLA